MKANCWMGKRSMEVREVPDPKILNDHDATVDGAGMPQRAAQPVEQPPPRTTAQVGGVA